MPWFRPCSSVLSYSLGKEYAYISVCIFVGLRVYLCMAEERFKASVMKARESACFPRPSWLQSRPLHPHTDSVLSCISALSFGACVYICTYKEFISSKDGVLWQWLCFLHAVNIIPAQVCGLCDGPYFKSPPSKVEMSFNQNRRNNMNDLTKVIWTAPQMSQKEANVLESYSWLTQRHKGNTISVMLLNKKCNRSRGEEIEKFDCSQGKENNCTAR